MTFVMKTTRSLQLYVKNPRLFGCQIKKERIIASVQTKKTVVRIKKKPISR
jgi:hypothetical protein